MAESLPQIFDLFIAVLVLFYFSCRILQLEERYFTPLELTMARMEHIPCPPPQPESRPELPKGALPLVPTPEKSKPAKAATGKGANAKGRKKVSFSNELSKAASSGQNCVSHTTEHQCSGYNEFCRYFAFSSQPLFTT